MKLIFFNGEYRVMDKARRLAILDKPLAMPSTIFNATWLGQDKDSYVDDCIELTREASSFKQLKHYVARLIIANKLPFPVPKKYRLAYERYIEANKETK